MAERRLDLLLVCSSLTSKPISKTSIPPSCVNRQGKLANCSLPCIFLVQLPNLLLHIGRRLLLLLKAGHTRLLSTIITAHFNPLSTFLFLLGDGDASDGVEQIGSLRSQTFEVVSHVDRGEISSA